jgi:hypothetical protein
MRLGGSEPSVTAIDPFGHGRRVLLREVVPHRMIAVEHDRAGMGQRSIKHLGTSKKPRAERRHVFDRRHQPAITFVASAARFASRSYAAAASGGLVPRP